MPNRILVKNRYHYTTNVHIGTEGLQVCAPSDFSGGGIERTNSVRAGTASNPGFLAIHIAIFNAIFIPIGY